jgi:hypothetical protein
MEKLLKSLYFWITDISLRIRLKELRLHQLEKTAAALKETNGPLFVTSGSGWDIPISFWLCFRFLKQDFYMVLSRAYPYRFWYRYVGIFNEKNLPDKEKQRAVIFSFSEKVHCFHDHIKIESIAADYLKKRRQPAYLILEYVLSEKKPSVFGMFSFGLPPGIQQTSLSHFLNQNFQKRILKIRSLSPEDFEKVL